MKNLALRGINAVRSRVKKHRKVRGFADYNHSVELDIDKKVSSFQNVFPVLQAENESIEYDETYILAMSARVGSTALLGWLQVAGLSDFQIREIFNNRGQMADNIEKWGGSSLANYLNNYSKLCGKNRLPFKTGWWDMAPLLKIIEDDMDHWLPNASWVYLERKDKVAQAYSLWKASQSGVWHQFHDGDSKNVSIETNSIPLDLIRKRMKLISLENDCWKRFFDQNGIDPTVVYYEDFLENPLGTMTKAYSAFTGDSPQEDTECPMARLSKEEDIRNVEYLNSQLSAG